MTMTIKVSFLYGSLNIFQNGYNLKKKNTDIIFRKNATCVFLYTIILKRDFKKRGNFSLDYTLLIITLKV